MTAIRTASVCILSFSFSVSVCLAVWRISYTASVFVAVAVSVSGHVDVYAIVSLFAQHISFTLYTLYSQLSVYSTYANANIKLTDILIKAYEVTFNHGISINGILFINII